MKRHLLLENLLLIVVLSIVSFSCKKEVKLPTLTITDISAITQSKATSGGTITSDGGATVSSCGVCWTTTSMPTIADGKTIDVAAGNTFTSQITALTPNTKYYVRAYAINTAGTAYSDERNFTTNPSLTGTWNKSFSINSSTYNGTLILVHNDNNTLTGSFVFSDGSGYTQLLNTSLISGTSVTIEWMLSTYKLSFKGTVNSAYTSMSGNYTANGTPISTWSATKASKKGDGTDVRKSTISEEESLLKLLKN
jgi:hypothetical protein